MTYRSLESALQDTNSKQQKMATSAVFGTFILLFYLVEEGPNFYLMGHI